MNWACGVTMVPERGGLLAETLSSLDKAGFPQPQLFIDFSPPSCQNPNRVGPFGNWWRGLVDLYVRNPLADRYAMFQDDVLLLPNTRRYLDETEYPKRGYWNLYTAASNCVQSESCFEFKPALQLGRGALALVFDWDALVALLSSVEIVTKPRHARHPTVKIDGSVCLGLKAAGWQEYVHNPSLAQHNSDTSTIPGKGDVTMYRSPNWPGPDFDAMRFLE